VRYERSKLEAPPSTPNWPVNEDVVDGVKGCRNVKASKHGDLLIGIRIHYSRRAVAPFPSNVRAGTPTVQGGSK